MTITVFGMPAPQGSKKFMGIRGGKGIMVESSKAVKPWREAVKYAGLSAMEEGELSLERHCNGAMPGAIEVRMIFTLPKPKSAPKRLRTWPDRKPDLDKLCRSTIDALTDAGVWEDDARIIKLSAKKCYPGEGSGSLSIPGAFIEIQECKE